MMLEIDPGSSNMVPVYMTVGFLVWLYFFRSTPPIHETIATELAFRELFSREIDGYANMQQYVEALQAGIREGGSETHLCRRWLS